MGSQIRFSISTKLVAATIALILGVAIPIAFRNAFEVEKKLRATESDANAELAKATSIQVNGLMRHYLEKIRMVSDLLLQDFSNEEQRKRALDLVFYNDLDLINVEIYTISKGRVELYRRESNQSFLQLQDIAPDFFVRLQQSRPFPVMSLFSAADAVLIENRSVAKGPAMFTIGIPTSDAQGVVRHVTVADVRLDRMQESFSAHKRVRSLYLVDPKGALLAHTDDSLVLSGRDWNKTPIVAKALEQSHARTGDTEFKDPESGVTYIGAYSLCDFGLVVIAQTPTEFILEPARDLKNKTFAVVGYALSIVLFFVIIFSLTITGPIERLHHATQLVANGNFEVKARVVSHDEIGDLARSFNHMVDGLKERDKVKNILNKFHGSTVTADLMEGDLHLGGTRKDVTVFFSDIRDFTKFSEGHTPEEVVEMLNEYFQIMVGVITKHHGVVDKFVGDAIMAIWGAPKTTGQDQAYAVQASLEMRIALAKLNEERLGRGQTAIKIGMGLHSGPAISGTIGSTERMEYTVIGDTVNMASRIESSTKAFGADLLVSEVVVKEVEKFFVLEYAGAAEVKGKSEPIKMFKVRGYYDDAGKPFLISTPYSDYEAEHAEKVKVA